MLCDILLVCKLLYFYVLVKTKNLLIYKLKANVNKLEKLSCNSKKTIKIYL